MVMVAIAGLGTYAAAGGWAVITVVNPPEYLEAGSTYQVQYMVRQHGVTLLTNLDGSVVVQPGGSPAAATPVTFRSQAGSVAGSYTTTIRVPDADRVTLSVKSGFSGNGWGDLTLMSIPVIRPGGVRPVTADADRGHQLFVAKGCGTCHVNGDVSEFAQMNRVVGVGPELTGRRLEASYVRQRLTNPSSLPKLGDGPVRMPDLGLSPAEVTALVALLTGTSDRATR
jgi:mono/diheme cytochrome c family protein